MTKVFSKYGKLCSVWVAQRPAGFAFIEYEDNEDAEGKTNKITGRHVQKIFLDAVRALDGREICGQRVRVEMRKKQRRIGNERTENDLR